jgi:hypothetical protein
VLLGVIGSLVAAGRRIATTFFVVGFFAALAIRISPEKKSLLDCMTRADSVQAGKMKPTELSVGR